MEKYTVIIEETLAQSFTVWANNDEDAVIIAAKKYKNGDLVLEQGEVQYKRIALAKPDNSNLDWIEF